MNKNPSETPKNEAIIPADIGQIREMIDGYISAAKRLGKWHEGKLK